MRQNTFITVFLPPHSKAPSDFGLLEFTRTELLANMQPGNDDIEHNQLLGAALRLAIEDPERGGYGSVATRARLDYGQPLPYWRYATTDRNLEKAGRALSRLFVPVRDGSWRPASDTVRPDTWPNRPEIDDDRLLVVAREQLVGEHHQGTGIDEICGLIGVGGIPIVDGPDGAAVIDGWADLVEGKGGPLHRAARTLVYRWSTDLDCLVRNRFSGKVHDALRKQLLDEPWLVSELTPEECGGTLLPGTGGQFPLIPGQLWWQDPRRGVRTKLLPRIECDSSPPRWATALGISGLGKSDRDFEDRPTRALQALKLMHQWHPLPPQDLRFDFEQTYTRLVEILPDGFEGTEEIPVLVRRYDSERSLKEIAWADPKEESVWHDTGVQSYALAAFRQYSIWVVRRGPRRLATALGIKEFAPDHPEVIVEGTEDVLRRDDLLNRLVMAFPDMFAAAAIAPVTPTFDAKEATRRQAVLTLQHAEDAYLIYKFDDKEGDLGRVEEGDVFMVPERVGQPAHIVFDGTNGPLPLIECARPLSELLCDNRAFVSVFKDALVAWSQAQEDSVGGSPVRRFRRDHGLSDEDVQRWRDELLAHRMNDTQRQDWNAIVLQVLSSFGPVFPEKIIPGATVTPETWNLDGEDIKAVTEGQVTRALRDALSLSTESDHSLVPTVSFASFHLQTLHKLNRALFVAAAAQRRGRQHWNEELYEDLWNRARAEPDDQENARCRVLTCDVQRLMRERLGLDPTQCLSSEEILPAARAFAHGQIPLSALPDMSTSSGSLAAWKNEVSAEVRDSMSSEDWAKKARRQAVGGGRAENAVVTLARAEALKWFSEDPESFEERAREALSPFLGSRKVADRLSDAVNARTGKAIDRLLQVSNYIGNAGFDVLVPRAETRQVQRVEVKRVADLDSALFYLSENERRQAISLAPNWHLWLVSSDGRSRDASWIQEHLRAGNDEVGNLMSKGLRPSDWLFRIQSTKETT